MTAEEITDAFNTMSVQLQQVQTALAAEQVTAADLRQSMNRGADSMLQIDVKTDSARLVETNASGQILRRLSEAGVGV